MHVTTWMQIPRGEVPFQATHTQSGPFIRRSSTHTGLPVVQAEARRSSCLVRPICHKEPQTLNVGPTYPIRKSTYPKPTEQGSLYSDLRAGLPGPGRKSPPPPLQPTKIVFRYTHAHIHIYCLSKNSATSVLLLLLLMYDDDCGGGDY